MVRSARFLRYAAFGLMSLFGLAGGTFVAGETFSDPGGWRAVALTAAWTLPLVLLSLFALRHPAAAVPVLVGATAFVVTFTLVDSAFGILPRDNWGPVMPVALFATGIALAFLGLHRTELAGLLMVTAGLAQLAASTIDSGSEPRHLFGGSSGVVVVPTLLAGLLFILAGRLSHATLRPKPRR